MNILEKQCYIIKILYWYNKLNLKQTTQTTIYLILTDAWQSAFKAAKSNH